MFLICIAFIVFASPPDKFNLMVAPGTLSDSSVTLLWDKQYVKGNAVYEVILNGNLIATTEKTNYTVKGLKVLSSYTVTLRMKQAHAGKKEYKLKFRTPAMATLFNILDFGAKADSAIVNTKAIQSAIDACTPGGTVYIPKGKFISGAIFLKSNMTLYIADEAVLKGTVDTAQYLPVIYNRFEGWELNTYASLINAGVLNRNGTYNVVNLRITGGGTIEGGGKKLGTDMWKTRGERSRGRLILLMNCQNVSIDNLTIQEPPSWTIHYIYSNNISLHNLFINTYGIRNGDGIDPDSSTDSYIFNCTFDNGDDCIAIKSGKNPEGYYIGKPTKNVRITHCNFVRGHGISIGSEMSGGVSDVLVQDCRAGALLNGMQIKGTKERGGYVRNVTVIDCELLKITIFSKLNYNNDGDAAPEPPIFENFVFKNVDLTKANAKEPVININGFKDPAHRLKNVLFEDIFLPVGARVAINDATNIKFIRVERTDKTKPEYFQDNSNNIEY